MSTTPTPEAVSVDLHVRSLAPRAAHAQQESAIDRLQSMEANGRLAAVTVDVWGRQVSLSTAAARTDAGRSVLATVESFREWADDTGRSLDSFFETRRVDSRVTGESYAALVLPAVTLAEYHDGDLAFVAPCSDGGDVVTVGDRLDHLESTLAATAGATAAGGPSLAEEEAEE